MKQVDRNLFNKLIEKGLICFKYNNKNFYITNQKKGNSKRKKIYVCEKVLENFYYLISKNFNKYKKNKNYKKNNYDVKKTFLEG